MTYKRAALFLFGGSILLLTPFLINFSEGVEKSIFSAMATLTDVKETLDDRLIKMSDLYLSLDSTPVDQQAEKVAQARQHYTYAKDVHNLATSFISASSKRYPRYSTFWERYSKRLASTWSEIESVEGKLIAFGEKLPQSNVVQVALGNNSDAPAVSLKMNAGMVSDKVDNSSRQKSVAAKTGVTAQEAAAAKKVVQSKVAGIMDGTSSSAGTASSGTASERRTQTVAKASDSQNKPTVSRVNLNQQDVLVKYREGYQYYAQGGTENLKKAAKAFSEILSVQPSFHLARYWISKTYLLLDDVRNASVESEKLLKAQPNLQIAKDLSREVKTVLRLKGAKAAAPVQVAQAPATEKAQPLDILSHAAPVKVIKEEPGHVKVIKEAAPVAHAAATVPSSEQSIQPSVEKNGQDEEDLDPATRAMLARINRKVGITQPMKTYSSLGGLKESKSHSSGAATQKIAPVAPVAPVRIAPVPKRVQISSASVTDTYAYNGPLAPESEVDHRPIACMIENSKRARPQSGLTQADIVYEMPVEGGITRFMAIFLDPENTNVSKLGPVRSARHYFIQQVPAFDALYAHCGASTLGYVELKKTER